MLRLFPCTLTSSSIGDERTATDTISELIIRPRTWTKETKCLYMHIIIPVVVDRLTVSDRRPNIGLCDERIASWQSNSHRACDSHIQDRDALVNKLLTWACAHHDNDRGARIFFFSGPEDTGKSSVCYTISEISAQTNMLGASCFFHCEGLYAPYRTFVKYLLAQLADFSPGCAELIGDKLGTAGQGWDARWNEKHIVSHFKSLFLSSLMLLEDHLPVLFIFDGLESLEGRDFFCQILAESMPILPSNLRFILTSRRALQPDPFGHLSNDLIIRQNLTTT
ncbi:hypothetical protein SISNIDRAFT_249495 [Sistotremastrum niveocremeum HHB9708]|uniref:Nephrocystin 3-like N-terminal domain-containing protein n=1 Tax=Sistotremastrum niveocremeum HHB9708 TaxID=1314777 RepID=A0A164YWI7_9AGAM|nr:hypothetical protein SISNIDRAFT_249495 [Sistotremastrum niveocremeum HHB9708]